MPGRCRAPRHAASGADLLVALAALLLLAGGAVAFVLANKPGDVSNPDVEFTAADDDGHAGPRRSAEGRRLRCGRPTAAPKDRTRDFSEAPRYLRPRSAAAGRYRERRADRVPARRSTARSLYLLDDDGMLRAIQQDERPDPLAPAGRPARRRLPRRRRRARLRGRAARDRQRDAAASPPTRASTGDRCGRSALPSRAESSPLLRQRARSTSAPRTGRVYALDAKNGARALDVQGRRRRQGRPALADGHALLRRLRRQGARRARAATASRSGRSAPTGRASASARAASTRRPRSRSGASTSATPTAASTRSPPRTGKLAWRDQHRRLRLRARPPSRHARPRADRLHRLLRRQLLRVRRPLRRRALAPSRPAAKISGSATIVGDVVYFSNLGTHDHRGRQRPHRPQGVHVLRRRVQPCYRRRPRDLLRRLHDRCTRCCRSVATPAWSRANEAAVETARMRERAARPAENRLSQRRTGIPAAARWRLDLAIV